MKALQHFYDWSEVWALLLPLVVWLKYRMQPVALRPVVVYLFIALIINTLCDIISDTHRRLPSWLSSNTPLYDLHSLLRFGCFWAFFWQVGRVAFPKKLLALAACFTLLVVANALFAENLFDRHSISGNTMAAEAFVLLACCLLYYFDLLNQTAENYLKRKDFWVVTGLSIYVVINFFVFLFYVPMITENPNLANWMWNVHNLGYIILCIFIAKAFHVSS